MDDSKRGRIFFLNLVKATLDKKKETTSVAEVDVHVAV